MGPGARARHIERRQSRDSADSTACAKPARRSGDETWFELLRVSAEIFASKGYSDTSLQEIAEALGMLKGSLYYYIKTKEDLLYEVVRTSTQSVLSAVKALETSSEPALDRLESMIEVRIRHLLLHLNEATVYLNDATKLSTRRRRQLPDKKYAHIFHSLIIEGQKDGSIRANLDDGLLLRTLMGYMNSIFKWYAPSESYSVDEVSRTTIEILRAGLRPIG